MQRLGRYQLLEKLGTGGTLETFLARGPGRGGAEELVVLSRVLPHLHEHPAWLEARARRLVEAQRLSAPWEGIWFAGEEDGAAIEIRELCLGTTLHQLARRARGLETAAAVWCCAEVCRAFEEAERLLPDFAPGGWSGIEAHHVRVSWEGELRVDGIELAVEAMNKFVPVLGRRFGALSPEELKGEQPDARTVVFRLTVLLYLALTGESPYTRESDYAQLEAVRKGEFTPLRTLRPELPEPLLALADRNFAIERSARMSGWSELRAALLPFAAEPGAARAALALRLGRSLARARARDLARLDRWSPLPVEAIPPELERAVQERPGEAPGWLVLGDWLEAQGNPRGRLVALHARREAAASPEERTRADDDASAWAYQHRALAPPGDGFVLEWRFGYVRKVELGELDALQRLGALLEHPSLRFLEELHDPFAEHAFQLVRVLAEARPRLLRTVRMPRLSAAEERTLRAALPQLQRVEAIPALYESTHPPPGAIGPPVRGFFGRLLDRFRGPQ